MQRLLNFTRVATAVITLIAEWLSYTLLVGCPSALDCMNEKLHPLSEAPQLCRFCPAKRAMHKQKKGKNFCSA
eukprot:2873296-Amphidinium_carterae.1